MYFSFISDWDVPRPNPLSTLISARLEFKVCQNKLKHQINESESLREEIIKLWKELVDKQTSLKTLHLEFEKLVSFSNVVYNNTETGKIFNLVIKIDPSNICYYLLSTLLSVVESRVYHNALIYYYRNT